MADSLQELWKKGDGEPQASDLVEGGLGIDVENQRAFSKDKNGAIFEIGSSITPSTGPILSGPTQELSAETITVTITNYASFDAQTTWSTSVTGGLYTGPDSAGKLTWRLPTVSSDTSHVMTVTATEPGKASSSGYHTVTVKYIPLENDQQIVYDDTNFGSQFTTLINMEVS